ncbi:MAG: TIGR03936 family radical SAM-associated protein [Anaerolineaceae bacterium]|nr:TIGR03936 family radical SAM-associated protein [Anaerolineaceae bacterium]
MNDTPIRIRVRYSKVGNLRFVGHLDTQRLFERALRRANLPLRYTQGFNKRIRLNLASALPLGFTSSAEVLDFWLDEALDSREIFQKLQEALPAEIRIIDLNPVSNSLPSLQASVLSSDYRIWLPRNLRPEDFQQKLDQLLQAPEILVSRRNKSVDYKPLIFESDLQTDSDSKLVWNLRLSSTPEGNARPDDILNLLEINPAVCLIERVGLNFITEVE